MAELSLAEVNRLWNAELTEGAAESDSVMRFYVRAGIPGHHHHDDADLAIALSNCQRLQNRRLDDIDCRSVECEPNGYAECAPWSLDLIIDLQDYNSPCRWKSTGV